MTIATEPSLLVAPASRGTSRDGRETRRASGSDGRPHPTPPLGAAARIVAAARLFAEGNGFLKGQLVDRRA